MLHIFVYALTAVLTRRYAVDTIYFGIPANHHDRILNTSIKQTHLILSYSRQQYTAALLGVNRDAW